MISTYMSLENSFLYIYLNDVDLVSVSTIILEALCSYEWFNGQII